jgi:lipopolysaccharide export LptBFGC system permease protein LptF
MMSSSTLIKIMKMDEQKAKEKGIDDKYANRIRFEFWNRINTPFLCIIFSFLGVCLGVQDNRGKKKNVGAISLLLLVTYYSVFFLLVTLSRKGAIPTPIAVFLPTAGTLYYAIKHYKKMDWFA